MKSYWPVEETFCIAIPDAAASRMQTPAELIAFIEAHVQTVYSRDCLTQHLFYQLRRGFRSAIPSLAAPFKPDTQLREVSLKMSGLLSGERFVLPRVTAVGRATFPWPGWLRDGPKTVRQLIWHLVANLPVPAAGEPWSRERIEGEVRRILADVLNKKDFHLSAKFIGELGVR